LPFFVSFVFLQKKTTLNVVRFIMLLGLNRLNVCSIEIIGRKTM